MQYWLEEIVKQTEIVKTSIELLCFLKITCMHAYIFIRNYIIINTNRLCVFFSFVTLFHKHMKVNKTKQKKIRFKNINSYLLRVCHFSGGADNVGIQALYSTNNRQPKHDINGLHGCIQPVLTTMRLCARARRRALVWKSNLLRVLMDLRQLP